MILGAGLGFKIALASGGLAGGVVLVTGAAQGGAEETSLAMKPETITELCSYTPPPDHASPTPATPSPAPSSSSALPSPVDAVSTRVLASLGLDLTQRETARVIVQSAASDGVPKRAVVIGVATALQESDLGHALVGDHGTSFGVFQQKATSGYGTREQILDPHHAAHEFFVRLQRVPHWQSLPLTKAAQAVQDSKYPDAYAKHEARAEEIVDALPLGSPAQSATGSPQASSTDHPLTRDEKATIESEVVVAAASGLSLRDATTKITQSVKDTRALDHGPVGQPPAERSGTDLQTLVADHVQKAAAGLCAELTSDVSNLPGNLSGSAHGVIVVQAAMRMLGVAYSFSGGPGGGITVDPRVCPAQAADVGNSRSATGVVQAGLDLTQRCVAAKVIIYAAAQLGKPYVWGAEGPGAFDCSGLVMKAYTAAGMTIPRTTFEQWPFGVRVPAGQEQPGDLVFFDAGPGSSPGHPGHVGIVLGGGMMIEARCRRCGPIAVSSYRSHGHVAGFTRPSARLRG